MEVNIIKDLSTLTTIDENTFSKLVQKVEWCINDAVESSILSKDTILNLDIGIGILIIKFDDTIKYKFIPSTSLEKSIINTITNERNDLKNNLETSLVNKLQNVYKNFF